MLVPFGAHFIFEIYSPLPRLQRIQAVRCLSNWITRIIIILIEVSVQLPNGHPAMSTGVNAFSYECKELLLHPQTLSSNRILYSHGCLHSISTAMLRRSVDVAGVRKIDGERERESGSCLCQSKLETIAVLALVMKGNVTLTIDKSKELDRPNEERSTKTFIISNFIMIVLLRCAISSLRWWVSLFSCCCSQRHRRHHYALVALIFCRDHRFPFYRCLLHLCVCRQNVPSSRDRNFKVQLVCLVCDRVLVCNDEMHYERHRWIVANCMLL